MLCAAAIADGHCTVPKIARLVLSSYIQMPLQPHTFSTERALTLVLTMIVMDGGAAFFQSRLEFKQHESND